jgi:hypothetical protein
MPSAPERIHEWAQKQFNAAFADHVTQDLVDVATGAREGNRWERECLFCIFPEWSWHDCGEGPWNSLAEAETFASVVGAFHIIARVERRYHILIRKE